jgi:hypothetical protein
MVRNFARILFLAAGLCFAQAAGPAAGLWAQEGVLPQELLRPRYGETPRFPRDYWIGELGRGEAGEDAYQAARRFLRAFAAEQEESVPAKLRKLLPALKELEVRTVRIGGGRKEADGSVSFLVRFLGREAGIQGELYLGRPAAAEAASDEPAEGETGGAAEAAAAKTAPAAGSGEWQVEDLILGEKQPLSGGPYSPGAADLTPYERFF